MAASRFQEASSSTSRSSYHDVFLNFRGADTRTPFPHHLHTALGRARFRTFRDDDDGLEGGQDIIKPKLQNAIKKSRMSIVVLSKNYASSSCCLNELAMILKCRSISGHIVLPVFYDVDPSELRRQKGSVKGAFTRLQRRIEVESGERREELMSKVEEWKAALEEVAYLAGINLQKRAADGHDFRCIQVIVEQVGETLIRTTFDIGLRQVADLPGGYFQSRTERFTIADEFVTSFFPLTLPSERDFVRRIAFSIEFGSCTSRPRNRTRNGEGTSSDLISLETLQQHFGSKRKDVADSLGISVSTLKRVCRFHGIPRWPHPIRNNVSRHSDPHGQKNPSPTFNMPSTNGQITMENEMGGPTECLPADSFEDPNFQNIGNAVYNETTTAGGSSQCVFQLEGQTTQSTAYPNHNALLFPQPQIASTEVLNENIGGSENRRDLLASQAEATPSQALASVPMIPHIISHLTEGSPKTFHLENEMGGLIPEPNEFLPDSFEVPSFENTLNGFMVDIDFHHSFPGNYHNANFLFSSMHNGTEAAGGSSRWEFQVQGQTTQFAAHPIPNVVVFPQPQIASTEVLSENMGSSEDGINFLASQGEAFLEGDVFESSNLTVPAASSDAASPSQPEATILHTRPTTPQWVLHLTGRSSEWAFQSPEFPAYPNPNDLVDPHPQTASTQIRSEIMGSLEDQSNLLAPQEEPLIEGHVFGSVNGTFHSSSETALSQQLMATIPDAMPTISDKTPTIDMMPHLAAREDTRSVTLKLTYGNKKVKFAFPLMSGIIELKEQVKKRLKTRLKKLDLDSFDIEYEDAAGDSILLGCDEDLRDHLLLSNNQEVRLLVVDSDANTENFR